MRTARFAGPQTASLAAQSAEQLSLAAVPLVAVLMLGAGAGEIGLLAAVQTLPFLLLSIPTGVLAERLPRRQLMVAAEGVRALALLALLVPAGLLAAANGRLELARSAAYAAGQALAGALVAWRHELLKPILLTAVAWNIAWFVLQAAYAPYAVRTLGLGAQAVGVTLACYGAGMVVGALFASRLLVMMPFGRAIQVGPAVSVLASALMVATLAVPSGVSAALSFFCFGVCPIIWTITSMAGSARPGASRRACGCRLRASCCRR